MGAKRETVVPRSFVRQDKSPLSAFKKEVMYDTIDFTQNWACNLEDKGGGIYYPTSSIFKFFAKMAHKYGARGRRGDAKHILMESMNVSLVT